MDVLLHLSVQHLITTDVVVICEGEQSGNQFSIKIINIFGTNKHNGAIEVV